LSNEKRNLFEVTEYRRAAKAGLVAGLVNGLIIGIPLFAIWQGGSFYDFIATSIHNSLPGYSTSDVNILITFALIMIPVGTALGGMLGGTIFGLMYAGIRHLDKQRNVRPIPSWIFGIVFFVAELAIIALTSEFHFGVAYGSTTVLLSAIGSTAFGYLLGYFFSRFGGRNRLLTTPNRVAVPANV